MDFPKSKENIIQKRGDIEKQLNDIIKSLGLSVNFEEIKEVIYNEQDQGALHNIMSKFDNGQDIDELNKILAIVNEAWNYFPHRVLGGLSPAEKILESQQ